MFLTQLLYNSHRFDGNGRQSSQIRVIISDPSNNIPYGLNRIILHWNNTVSELKIIINLIIENLIMKTNFLIIIIINIKCKYNLEKIKFIKNLNKFYVN